MAATLTLVNTQPSEKFGGFVIENDHSDQRFHPRLQVFACQALATQSGSDDADLVDHKGNVIYFESILYADIKRIDGTSGVIVPKVVSVSGSGYKLQAVAPANGVTYSVYVVGTWNKRYF